MYTNAAQQYDAEFSSKRPTNAHYALLMHIYNTRCTRFILYTLNSANASLALSLSPFPALYYCISRIYRTW